MRIDSAGNVGIGTSAPVKPLHIISSSAPQILMEPSLGSGDTELMIGRGYSLSGTAATVGTKSFIQCAFEGSDDNAYSPFGYVTTAVGNRSQIATAFYIETKSAGSSTPAERARIDSLGNFLVGTSSAFDATYRGIQAINTTGGDCAVFTTTGVSGTVVRWNKATSGNNQFIDFFTETSITARGGISYNRAGGLVAYNTTSDYRAKDISGPVTGSGALIDSIPVYMGTMKGATQERPMFIAHEVPAYARTGEKDAVDADGKPVYQQMDASALIPVMWAEIQSLRQRLSAANL
jgi:hypothetical protein